MPLKMPKCFGRQSRYPAEPLPRTLPVAIDRGSVPIGIVARDGLEPFPLAPRWSGQASGARSGPLNQL